MLRSPPRSDCKFTLIIFIRMTVADVAAFELKRRSRTGAGPATRAFSNPAAFTAALTAAVTGQTRPPAIFGQTDITVDG